MVQMGQTKREITRNVINRIKNDFSKQPGLDNHVDVTIHWSEQDSDVKPFEDGFITVETLDTMTDTCFEHHNESPSLLRILTEKTASQTHYHSSCLRSNCRVTNQPDWGDVYVSINGRHTITPESFCQYIVSMRDENHFHEEICECIYMRLKTLLIQTNYSSHVYTHVEAVSISIPFVPVTLT